MRYVTRLGVLAAIVLLPAPAGGETPASGTTARRPEQFMLLFNFGYGGDDLFPKDKATYEKLIQEVKAGNFTAIMGTYADWKVEICRKHGLKFVVNLLTGDHHVYKSPETARKLCESLRGHDAIWGYHLFSDTNSKTAAGRDRDIKNVHQWDPTHPTFVGFYKTSGMSRLTEPDVLGYYDFHWKRGPHVHFPHLLAYAKLARQREAVFYRWLRVTSGLPEKGNFNRNLYTANTSIACGLKGVFWFIGQEMMNRKTWEFNGYGRDIIKVNTELKHLGPEIVKLGNPVAIYSTPTTKSLKDREKGKNDPPVPKPLQAIPADCWVQVDAGEAVLGLFQDDRKRDAVFVANHNTYAPQQMKLRFTPAPRTVEMLDRKQGTWRKLELAAGAVSFPLAEAAGELLRVDR